jgi:hypothetical protein
MHGPARAVLHLQLMHAKTTGIFGTRVFLNLIKLSLKLSYVVVLIPKL